MSQVFHQKLEIKATKIHKEDFFISGHGLSAQPYLKQPWHSLMFIYDVY